MGKGQRVKGSVFEREVAAAFGAALGSTIKRHLGQARDGGEDIDAGKWVVECKRRKNYKTLEGYLNQVKHAIRKRDFGGGKPVVVMRADNGEAMALLPFSDFLELVATDHSVSVDRAAQVPK